MNTQTQSEIDMKLSVFEQLGDNPNEIDIIYVSYLFKIPLQTIRKWLEERVEQDIQIDISQIEDTDCQLIECVMNNKELINQQNQLEDEDDQQKQLKIQLSIDTKETQISKLIDKYSYKDKIIDKDLSNLVVKQFQQISNEDNKIQDKNIQENQNANLLYVQQNNINEVQNKQNQNIDIQQQQDQLNQQQIIKQQQHKQKEKEQEEIKLIEQSNSQQQSKSLIVNDDEINLQNQISKKQIKEIKQKKKKLNINNKQQTLQDLTNLRQKKIKNPIQQILNEIGQNKILSNGIIKQTEQKQDTIK